VTPTDPIIAMLVSENTLALQTTPTATVWTVAPYPEI
jgi:hypothetical protein